MTAVIEPSGRKGLRFKARSAPFFEQTRTECLIWPSVRLFEPVRMAAVLLALASIWLLAMASSYQFLDGRQVTVMTL